MDEQQLGIARFGVTEAGENVQKVTIGRGGLTVSILTYGAILQGVWLAGLNRSLTLGSDKLGDYEGAMAYHGSLIVPVANRIGGATAVIDGHRHQFEGNQNGRICLHSGATGAHRQVWKLAEMTETSCTLRLTLPDGLGGFPGTRRVTVRYAVGEDASLNMQVTAFTDQPTLMNIANHSYWNLDGTPDWAGHSLRIAADRYLPTDADLLPTGQIAPCADTALDFRSRRVITPQSPEMDTCFVLSDSRQPLRDVLWLTGASGLTMTIATTEPGIQVYDGRDARRPNRGPYEGLAIEPQFWPDAPNQPAFPAITLSPGKPYQQESEWRFNRG